MHAEDGGEVVAGEGEPGRAFGGHLLPGCTVNTTAEIVLAEIRSCVFTRRPDSETGYEELEIGPAYPEETRNDRREER